MSREVVLLKSAESVEDREEYPTYTDSMKEYGASIVLVGKEDKGLFDTFFYQDYCWLTKWSTKLKVLRDE